jgi:ADP-ribose pyrophosphatase
MQFKLLKRNNVYRGRVFNTIVDEVKDSFGRDTIREVAEHVGGSVVLALFPDQQIILINQHRYPFDRFIWELPAGKLDADPNGVIEDPRECARRELEEETGYIAKAWKQLTSIYTSPGFCSEVLHIFLATDLELHPDGRKLEPGEETMTMKILPLQEAIHMVDRQEIIDAKTICGLLIGERIMTRTAVRPY